MTTLITLAACAVLVLALLAAFALGDSRSSATASEEPAPRRVTAAGVGTAAGVPDVMRFTVGVDVTRDDVGEALDDSDALMKRVLASVRKAGVADKDIRTQRYAIDPRYDYSGNIERLIGYHVTQRARITLRDLDSAGAAVARIARSGGNDVRIDGIACEVSEPDALLDEARANAVEQSRAHAEVYARAAGAELGEVLEVRESSAAQRNELNEHAALDVVAVRSAVIEPGETELDVRVSVVWSLR